MLLFNPVLVQYSQFVLGERGAVGERGGITLLPAEYQMPSLCTCAVAPAVIRVSQHPHVAEMLNSQSPECNAAAIRPSVPGLHF
jgi:hypothetical protein